MTVKQCDESMTTDTPVYRNELPYRVTALKGAAGLVEIIPWGDPEIVDAKDLRLHND